MSTTKFSGSSDTPAKESNQETTTMQQVLDVFLIIGELFILWIRMVIEILKATFKKIVPHEQKSVKGDIVLITGTGHGIGRELALQYAALGATVVCWDINAKNNEQTIKDIAFMGYPKAYSYECDVSNREQVLAVAKKVKAEVGAVTVLVNNAGIMPCHLLKDHSEEEIRKIFAINILAHFWMLEAVLPSMIENNRGHIVALSSVAGLIGFRNLVPYCASKFAVRGMMEALHEELRETIPNTQIKFTIIYPYMVDTGLCKNTKIKFPSIMSPIPTKKAASKIIEAMRSNKLEASIPEYMFKMNNFFRLFPDRVVILFKNFVESSVESDLM